jgi:hypothetical protein
MHRTDVVQLHHLVEVQCGESHQTITARYKGEVCMVWSDQRSSSQVVRLQFMRRSNPSTPHDPFHRRHRCTRSSRGRAQLRGRVLRALRRRDTQTKSVAHRDGQAGATEARPGLSSSFAVKLVSRPDPEEVLVRVVKSYHFISIRAEHAACDHLHCVYCTVDTYPQDPRHSHPPCSDVSGVRNETMRLPSLPLPSICRSVYAHH